MRMKTWFIQNLILALGIICLYKFLSLKLYYQQIESWKNFGQPIIDGDGVGLTFMGFSLDDDGVHWTEIIGVANVFLTIGILLILISIGILIWKSLKIKS